jgi:hypothetical protein
MSFNKLCKYNINLRHRTLYESIRQNPTLLIFFIFFNFNIVLPYLIGHPFILYVYYGTHCYPKGTKQSLRWHVTYINDYLFRLVILHADDLLV